MPRSLAGQMALLLGIALLIAQLVNFALLLGDRQRLSLAQTEGPAITRFAGVAADVTEAAPEFLASVIADSSYRGAHFAIGTSPGIAEAGRDPDIEARLKTSLADAGVTTRAVRASTQGPGDPALASTQPRPPDLQHLFLSLQRPDGSWLNARMTTPKRDPFLPWRLALATLVLYLLVLGMTIWMARRLARPLGDLTRAAEAFQGRGDPVVVVPRGPDDLRLAIEAFNAMNDRVAGLLEEKDYMLGAIGHDLRTPLTSLRIRVESMEPDDEREAAVAKIGEMTAMLEDILVLARSGRVREVRRKVNVNALVEAVVEDHNALGHTVEFTAGLPVVADIQPALLKRAIGNLVDNAIKYGGDVQVAVTTSADAFAVAVSDTGPGVPAADLARMLKPFHRLEDSRSRETGGSGLGLAIADSIAKSHGGALELANAAPHGFIASLKIPL